MKIIQIAPASNKWAFFYQEDSWIDVVPVMGLALLDDGRVLGLVEGDRDGLFLAEENGFFGGYVVGEHKGDVAKTVCARLNIPFEELEDELIKQMMRRKIGR